MPSKLESKSFRYYFYCPECNKENYQTFSWLKSLSKEKNIKLKFWCRDPWCNAQQMIRYRISLKRTGEPKIKVFEFISNGEPFNKRFRLEEPKTKGK